MNQIEHSHVKKLANKIEGKVCITKKGTQRTGSQRVMNEWLEFSKLGFSLSLLI